MRRTITLDHHSAQLEIEVSTREDQQQLGQSSAYVGFVILPPYPPLGGSIDDHVVRALHRRFASPAHGGEPAVVVSVNPRGAGQSGGRTSWTGISEANDIAGVISRMLDGCKGLVPESDSPKLIKRLVVIGYSYGSVIAASAIANMSAELGKHLERVDLICISYPYTVLPFLTLHKQGWHLSNLEQFAQGNNRRLLLVYGTKDQFTGTGSYERLRNRLDSNANGNATINVIDGADHFWHDRNYKDRLIQYIVDFANSQQSV